MTTTFIYYTILISLLLDYGYYSLNKRLFPVNDNKCYLYSLDNPKSDEPEKEIDDYPIK